MWDIGWGIAVALLFLLNVVVFADLFRAECSEARARRVPIEGGQVLTVKNPGTTATKEGPHTGLIPRPPASDCARTLAADLRWTLTSHHPSTAP
jgi:hypothetical protein